MTYASEKRRLAREHLARQAAEFAEHLREEPELRPKAWAWRLRARELAGENLRKHLRRAWRAALEQELLAMPNGGDR